MSKVNSFLSQFKGYHTDKKILVIESDDWGGIRTSSKKSYEELLRLGYPVDHGAFSKFDALETNKDLEFLIDTLQSVKNRSGEHAKMTLNYIVANPNFDKIKEGAFNEYYYEKSEVTATRYKNTENLKQLYSDGIQSNSIQVQLHGREHVHYNRWLNDIKQGKKFLIDAFDREMFSLRWEKNPTYSNEYMDAFNVDNIQELDQRKNALIEASLLFEERFGFKSKSFIACCYIWHSDLHEVLIKSGVNYIQGLGIQHEPIVNKGNVYNGKHHFMGEKNDLGQFFLTRNAFFEPAVHPTKDVISSCLKRIALAFRLKKPAIVSSHRLNFVGRIFPENRDHNLKLLRQLLEQVVKTWPNVEFMSSDELGELIADKYSQCVE